MAIPNLGGSKGKVRRKYIQLRDTHKPHMDLMEPLIANSYALREFKCTWT